MISHRLALLSILAVTFGLLVDEIMLSAIFHVLLGAGNTVAAIAIALVGLSASGIVAYSVPAFHVPERSAAISGALLFWFSVSLLGSVYAIMAVPISHGDLIYYRSDPAVQLWRFAVYHITVIPFFLGGLTIAVLFRSQPSRIGRLYFADLFGAAVGCLASPILLGSLGAPGAVLSGAAPAALLASGLAVRRGGWRRALPVIPVLLLVMAVARPELLSFATINTMGEVSAPKYRSFPIQAGDIEYERWALDAWTIIRGPDMPQQWENFRGWGLSPRYRGSVPATRLVNYNARFSTYVTSREGDPKELGEWIDADLTGLHHLIGRDYEEVLNIGAGGGREVLAALHHGAKRVVAVDVSEVVVDDVMKRYLREFSGELYLDPRVEAIADEGRSFAERSSERFDLVEFSIVGGMNLEKMDLVRVDDLFTVEALRTYLRRLDEDGVFSYVMYSTRSDLVEEIMGAESALAQPYIPALRTLTGLRVALEEIVPGARFADHVLIAALPKVINPRYDLVHIIVSLRPFAQLERQRFLETCDRLGFSGLYPNPDDLADPGKIYTRIAVDGDLSALAARLPFSIWPATDDRPFQYALEPSHLLRALERGELFALLSGNPLVSLGLSIGSLAVLLTLTPLLVSARRAESLRMFRSSWSLLLYFACIGFAYMSVEITALLRLQSYLGKPIYGLSVGLFAFLLASGLGSNFTLRLSDSRLERSLTVIVILLVSVGILFVPGSSWLFSSTISWSLPARLGLATAAVFPIAFPMGMLFPIGVRLIARDSEDLIPWAWATNGCFSVLGIFGARITALLFGFSRSLVVGLVVYLLVIGCVQAHSRSARSATSES
jgi:SAM-dependent methyltransferase